MCRCRNISILFLLLPLLCNSGTGGAKAVKPSDLSELLDRFQNSFAWYDSVTMDVSMEVGTEKDGTVLPDTTERSFTFRRDHERMEWLGQWGVREADGTVDPDARGLVHTVNTGDTVALLSGEVNVPPLGAHLERHAESNQEHMRKKLGAYVYGGPLWGRNMGNGAYNVAEVLATAADVHVQEHPENVNGVSCQVVEARTEYGEVRAWIAPEKGYAAMRWSVQKEPGNRYDDRLVDDGSVRSEFTASDLQEVDGFWIPTAGHFTYHVQDPDAEGKIRTNTDRVSYNVSNVTLHPDFDALKAFQIDFPEGTPVTISDAPGISYIWHSGRPVLNLPDKFLDEVNQGIEMVTSEAARSSGTATTRKETDEPSLPQRDYGGRFLPGPYCGISCMYVILKMTGREVDYKDLIKRDYISLYDGSSIEELQRLAEDYGLYTMPARNLTTRHLRKIRCPVLLHVKKSIGAKQYDHFELFLGMHGDQAKLFDPRNRMKAIPLCLLAPRWDGRGMLVSVEPIDLRGIQASFGRHFVFWVACTIVAIVLLRLMSRRLRGI